MTARTHLFGLALPPAYPRRYWRLPALVFGAVTLCVVVNRLAPQPVASLAALGPLVLSSIAMMVAPFVHRAEPRLAWAAEVIGATFLLSVLTLRATPLEIVIGPVNLIDVLYLGAYLAFLTWFSMLAQHVGGGPGLNRFLDMASVTAGTCLAQWTITMGQLSRTSMSSATTWTVYPVLDLVFVGLVLHVTMRLRRVVPALAWVLPGLLILLVVDTLVAVDIFRHGGVRTVPELQLGYLYAYACLALAAIDPSVPDISRPAEHAPAWRGGRPTALLLVSISPVILTAAFPVFDTLDRVVRVLLVASLVILVFMRLSRTLSALADAEERSHHRATHDALTGLLNRSAVLERLRDTLAQAAETGRTTVVLFLDCDRFKHVNDTWGHAAGDSLLRGVACRLAEGVDGGGVVARHGGDEFVVVAEVDEARQGLELAERVQRCFDEPIGLMPGRAHAMTPSIGIAIIDAHESCGPDEALARADAAMYEAKRGGRGRYRVFDAPMARRMQVAARVGDRLEDAIREGALTLALQPIHGGPDYGRIVGFEALSRWDDPVLGVVSPEVFIPVAEQSGLIVPLGADAVRSACRDLARLRAASPASDPAISVNVSPSQLLAPSFVDTVLGAVTRYDVPAGRLTLEVTETMLVHDGPEIDIVLAQLRGAGVRVCIDDFGTGYAALTRLLRLPVDAVKLDRQLVERIDSDPAARSQLAAVLELVASLGLDHVVAEGVETAGQERVLADLGCPMVQGRRYSGPAPLDHWLAAAPAHAS